MTTSALAQIEDKIARCRLVLSLAVFVALYVDPTQPLLARWIPLTSGAFVMDRHLLILMAGHVVYSLTVYVGLSRGWFGSANIVAVTMWGDVVYGAAIATFTEGVTSPFYPFFAFGVAAVGFRAGLRPAMLVTEASVGLYLFFILLSTGRGATAYVMRPVYLAITGYLVGYLGQQRLDLEEEIRQLEAAQQRHRIGRDLHDGFMQALAGVNLRLESCRRHLRAARVPEAWAELTELQESLNREYDELRADMRALAGMEVTPRRAEAAAHTQLQVTADFTGSVDLVEHVLQIVREGISNIRRHADAAAASVRVSAEDSQVRISIEDDGVGFGGAGVPWSIASRVKEIGGELQCREGSGPGAHLAITLRRD